MQRRFTVMATEDPPTDISLLTKIGSIESKVRTMCDLIPISTWGFSADIQEKLRQRKHRIVNQKLTAKEKKMLTNSKKQQVARTVGGVCRRVSEVIDLLGTSSTKDVKPKRVCGSIRWSCQKPVNVNGEKKKTTRQKYGKVISFRELKPQTETNVPSGNDVKDDSDNNDEDDTTDEEVENVAKGKSHKRNASTSDEIAAKRLKFNVEPVQCSTKDQSLDVLEQRELAIRKLQEKLKSMKANRQSKKKASADPSAALKFEQERKLKRRMSKMKMKQRRAEEKRGKVEEKSDVKKEVKHETSKDEVVSFSKFDFLVKSDGKKKRLSTSEKKQKFTGKDYKSLINKVEKREEKLKKIRDVEPEKAMQVENEIKWNRAVNKAQGVKVKDNIELLKKGLKRKEKLKEKRKENWLNREKNVEREKAKKQEKRKENLQKRIDDKKKNKLKGLKKKGRVL
ncbi:surfeit locus protein 6 [Necator americanus]|uniref:Surfeit locus protein 6 n=1 Tax=Necator americanus TaxID=51031 RepID=W2SZW7_NECAM|nr:surfeit locus protein 6 [Necator americanus]ETN75198.1 surfeit locus protein 6 [Necator americanus]